MSMAGVVATAFAGRITVTRPLGEGGEAETFLARDHELDADVVVKVRRVDGDADLSRLRREARMLLRLVPHPLLPVVRRDLVHDGHYLLVSDHVPGTDLATVLARQGSPGLAPGTVLAHLDQVAAALDHLHMAHDPPVVHGDVKPENLVLTDTGRVVLIDFGTSTHRGEDGIRAGTPGFTAPEVVAGEAVTPAADVYSLAAVAVTLLTGTVPIVGGSHWEGLRAAQITGVEGVLRRALSFDWLRRPTRASELVAQLRAAVELDLPTGTVTLCLASAAGHGGARWASDVCAVAERHGAHRVTTAVVPADHLLFAFTHAAQAARAGIAMQRVAGTEAPATRTTVGLHAGDLGGWHGTTVRHLCEGLAALVSGAPAGSLVCSPPVRLLLGDAHDLRFDRHGTGLLVTAADRRPDTRPGRDALAWARAQAAQPLAGRAAAPAELLTTVSGVAERSVPGFHVVVGDPGAGKSRVLAEVLVTAGERGARVLVGRCSRVGGAYEPFDDALGAGVVPTGRDAEGSDDGRHHVLDRVVRSLGAADRPVVLAIDDLHWLDASSIALLADLLAEPLPNLTVLGTVRTADWPADLEPLLAGARRTAIEPLDDEGLAELAGTFGVRLDADEAQALGVLTGGNPFVARQVLQRGDGAGEDRGHGRTARVGATVWVQRRLAELPEPVRATLVAGAVLGSDVDVVLLAAVLGVTPFDVLPHLEAGAGARLVEPGAHPGTFRFGHEIVRAALADTLGPTRRALLHADIAARLEEHSAGDDVADLAAHHWLAAGRLGDPLRAGMAVLRLAESSLDRCAPERAVGLLDRALELVPSGGADRDRVEVRLRAARGRALLLTSRLVVARTDLLAAADGARRLGDGDTLAEVALAASLHRRHGLDDPDLLRLVEIAEQECPPTRPELAALLTVRRARLLPPGTPQERRAALARRALEDLDELFPIDRIRVELEVARACWGPDDAAHRERLASRHAERARHERAAASPRGWTSVLVESLSARAAARLQLGHVPAALADTIEAAEVAEADGNRFLATRARMGEAVVAALQGRHDDATRLAAAAASASGRRHNLVLAELAIAWSIGRDQGRQAELGALEPKLAALVDDNPMFVAAFALVHAEAGNRDDARRLTDRLSAGPWPRDWMWLACAVATLEVGVLLDDVDLVRRYRALLARYSGQWALAGAELACLGPVDRVLGLAAVHQGDVDVGRALLARAAAAAEAASAGPWKARADAALAQLVNQSN